MSNKPISTDQLLVDYAGRPVMVPDVDADGKPAQAPLTFRLAVQAALSNRLPDEKPSDEAGVWLRHTLCERVQKPFASFSKEETQLILDRVRQWWTTPLILGRVRELIDPFVQPAAAARQEVNGQDHAPT